MVSGLLKLYCRILYVRVIIQDDKGWLEGGRWTGVGDRVENGTGHEEYGNTQSDPPDDEERIFVEFRWMWNFGKELKEQLNQI